MSIPGQALRDHRMFSVGDRERDGRVLLLGSGESDSQNNDSKS